MKKLLSTILGAIFLLFICFNITKVIYASTIPNVYKIDFENPRIYEGIDQNISIYAKANSNIQYKLWLYTKEDNSWKEITNAYTDALSPQKAFTFTIPKLKFGEYTLSIWIKTAGKEPLNKKGYDNYYAYNFFCSHYDGQVYNRYLDKSKTEKSYNPSIEKIVAEVPYLYQGDFQTFHVLSKGFEDVQYRIWINNKTQNNWKELTKGYVDPLYAQKVYSIATPKLSFGDYTLSVWIKRANKEPLNIKGYDDYASFNFNCLEKDPENNVIQFDKLKSNYDLTEKIEFNNSIDVNSTYRYNIFDILSNKLIVVKSDYKSDVKCAPLKEGAYILQLDIKTLTQIKADKDVPVPIIEDPNIGVAKPTNDEKDFDYKVLEKVTTINKLLVVGNPYKKSTGKVAYLTFDDGPSKNVTPKILNILDKYDIKATFFVTGINADAERNLITQTYERGHVIANHSYSHDYNKIYSSTTAFVDEIEKTNSILKDIIPGYNTKIFRFPGGSYGRNDAFKLAVKNLNYVYYDWDALNGDAEGYLISKDNLIARTKETVTDQSSVILLMHDTGVKTTTADSLPAIIEFLISSGYEFKTLEEFNK
jgi:peptidoglycan/xylan/chitin deacetylase (PgdA/CDA1 family)